jgi:hypothetical protein
MKKIIYIIPGLGETCSELRYKKLADMCMARGYAVKPINPDWYQPLSGQVIRVEKDAIVFGFSFGAVLAYLIAKKHPYRKAIFASLSPIHTFSFTSLESDYRKDIEPKLGKDLAYVRGTQLARDIKRIKVSLKSLTIPYITLAGEYERGLPADMIVPKTGHYLSIAYIKYIEKVI